MKIGILSDTHNNLTNLQAALMLLRKENVDLLIHCGDISSPETAAALGEFRIIHVVGNNDYASGAIHEVLLGLNSQNISAASYKGEIGGVKIAVTHGHQPGVVQEIVSTGEFAYVFTGHSHQRRDTQVGPTRVINPGSLGGLKREKRSIYILDLVNREGNFYLIE
jgi:putative phosphoesterase